MTATLPEGCRSRRPAASDARFRRAAVPTHRSSLSHPIPATAAAVLMGLALSGCGATGREARAPAPPAVAVQTVVLDSSAVGSLVLPARVKAREEVVVGARVAGRVTVLLASEGQRVRGGQPLARFDAPESRRALEAARREFEAATLGAEGAGRQQARMESLLVARVAAPRDREVADAAAQAADARLESARAGLENLAASFEVRAPFAGVIAQRHVDAGADVQPGTPLFTVRSTDGTEIVLPVPEAALPALPGAQLAFEVDGQGWQPARLLRVDGMTDFSTRTRTAHLAPAAGSGPDPGAFARVRIESPRLPDPPLPLLPSTGIVRRGALTGAFVIADGRAELRWLRLGREQGGQVEVLSGLLPGERVARFAGGLADGARVRIES